MLALIGPFEAIQYVGTPLALVAFVVAVVAYVIRARLAERRKLLETAPEDRRAELLAAAMRDFSPVSTENLTREQRYQLALRLIQERATRFWITAGVATFVAVVLAIIVLVLGPGQAADASADLVVRLQGPAGPANVLASGEVTFQAGALRRQAAVGPDGQALFAGLPRASFEGGATLTATADGYHPIGTVTFTTWPPGGAVVVPMAPDSTVVRGTVLDDPTRRRPLAGVQVDFGGGLVVTASDALGHFQAILPRPAGARIALALRRDGVTGFDDVVTVAPDQDLVVYFEAGTSP